MKLVTYFHGKIDEMNALLGIDAGDWDDIYNSSTDEELEYMGQCEEALDRERQILPLNFHQYAL